MNLVFSKKVNFDCDDSANLVTRDAAHLSAVEFALGSLAHALHIPFTGHLLALNQGAFLSHAAFYSENRQSAALACYEISGVAATIKSFSPTGKKLGPMLGIMMQGLLFSLGLLLFGRKKLGQFIGMIFLSAWAFFHPLLSLLLTFGPTQLREVVRFYVEKMNLDYQVAGFTVLSVILTLYFIKLIFASLVVRWINQKDEQKWQLWQQHLVEKSEALMERRKENANLSAFKGSLRDLKNPLFLFSFALTWIFLLVQKESWSEFMWQALRPVGIAFVIFYLLRSPEFLKFCGVFAQRFGILMPIHHRLQLVHQYWHRVATPNSAIGKIN